MLKVRRHVRIERTQSLGIMNPIWKSTPGAGAGGYRCRVARLAATFVSLITLTGCFSERSVRLSPQRLAALAPSAAPGAVAGASPLCSAAEAVAAAAETAGPPTTRSWLRAQHPRLARLLPRGKQRALLTDDLRAGDEPEQAIDVAAYFGVKPSVLHKLTQNLNGISHTAQASGRNDALGAPAAAWPGFEDVWIPIDFDPYGLEASCRIGFATDAAGRQRDADCIVLLPGIFGDNAVQRTRDIALSLRDAGFHVCAVELRGCGQTHKRFPNHAMMFGVLEAGDLLAIAEWLEAKPQVRRTGLVGFCWGSNIALLTAWENGRRPDEPGVAAKLAPALRPPTTRRHFEAGILNFSAVLPFEDVADKTDTPVGMLTDPVINSLEKQVQARQEFCGYANPDTSLWKLIDEEFARAHGAYPGSVLDGRDYLRLYPYRDKLFVNKLERIEVPTLFVHAANDPLTDAQPLANLIVQTQNPNVAAVVLPGGGHVGFGPYAPEYFYGLMLSFFDPIYGAAAPKNTVRRFRPSAGNAL